MNSKKWFSPLLALITGLALLHSLYKEQRLHAIPFTRSEFSGSPCNLEILDGWLAIFRRTVCYPQLFKDFDADLFGSETAAPKGTP